MAGQAILGETALKPAKASETESAGESVEALVVQHTQMVFRIAYSILRNLYDAEDAAQECFLRILKSRDRLRQVRNTKTWVARIAWTAALDHRRGRSLVTGATGLEDAAGDGVLAVLADPALAADERLAEAEMQQLLERLIAGLPEDLRLPLQLSTVQELNSAEIAEVLSIPAESVRTRLLRARRLIKEKMAVVLEVNRHD